MTANIPEHSGFTKIPYGKLGIIAMKGTEELAAKIDKYIVDWRKETLGQDDGVNIAGYAEDSFLIKYSAPVSPRAKPRPSLSRPSAVMTCSSSSTPSTMLSLTRCAAWKSP